MLAAASSVWAQVPSRTAPRDAERTGHTAAPRLRVGVDANPKASTTYRRGDWEEAIELMRTTSANNFHYAKVWKEIEPRPGTYELEDVEFALGEAAPLPVAFNLRVLDAGSRNMPDAYQPLPWDSSQMVDHIVAVVERLAPVLGRRVWSYAIGNEIDMYFASRPGEIAAYARMLERVKPRIRALHPQASFTTAFQFLATSQLRTTYAPIVAALDHVAFTYYPLAGDFMVRPPSVVTGDLEAMMAAAQPRPIYLQEIGYPTAAQLGSSPELQSAFVRMAFEAVRAAGTRRVLGATYLFQSDFPEWLVNDVVRAYGLSSDNFRAFIGTLGLHDRQNRPKVGWAEFVRQAELSQARRSSDR